MRAAVSLLHHPNEPHDRTALVAEVGLDGYARMFPDAKGNKVARDRVAISEDRCRLHGSALRGAARELPLPCPTCAHRSGRLRWPVNRSQARTFIVAPIWDPADEAALVLCTWFDWRPLPWHPFCAGMGYDLAWLLPA